MSEPRTVALVWTLLLTMAVCGVLGTRQRIGAVVLALTSLVWLLVDQSFEGTVLLDVTSSHGLTTTDLVGVAGLVVALAEWLWLTRRRRR